MKLLLKISNSVLQIYSVMPSGMLFTKKKNSVGEVSATHFLLLHILLLQMIISSRKILYISRLQYKPKMSINRDYCVSGINCAAIKWNEAEINSHISTYFILNDQNICKLCAGLLVLETFPHPVISQKSAPDHSFTA